MRNPRAVHDATAYNETRTASSMLIDEEYRVRETDFDDEELRNWWLRAYHSHSLLRNTHFQSWEWNTCWYEHYVRYDSRRRLVLLRIDRDGIPVAAVPLFLQSRCLGRFRIWHYFLWIADRLSQYPDMITTESDASGAWLSTFAYLRRCYPGAWLRLHDILPESTIAPLLRECVPPGFANNAPPDSRLSGDTDMNNIRWSVEEGESYMRIDLSNADTDNWTVGCTPHLRREIARARRLRAQDAGLDWRMYLAPASDVVDRLIRLNLTRFGSASWFADERNRRHFRMLTRYNDKELMISEIRRDGRPLHLIACWLHGNTVHYVLSGMDPEGKRWSPGTVNLVAVIEWALRAGYHYFDFLRGDEKYKREYPVEIRASADVTVFISGRRFLYTMQRMLQTLRRGER
ncbi:MAG: GNAT family N-acetyltransferase [Bacteroidetes bacterium]|nr:GNAT family N-acetyltransferase [Bacteroidota bacterium]